MHLSTNSDHSLEVASKDHGTEHLKERIRQLEAEITRTKAKQSAGSSKMEVKQGKPQQTAQENTKKVRREQEQSQTSKAPGRATRALRF